MVELREVHDSDLDRFFEDQSDTAASWLAAVPSRERPAFDEHWTKIRSDPTTLIRTILYDGEVAGNVLSFERDGLREVGYWISRPFWGKGIATSALEAFLYVDTTRPLHAKVAGDNVGSVRVLEKCGFRHISSETAFDETRGAEIQDLLLELA